MPNSKRKAHCNKKPFSSLLAAQIGLRKTLSLATKRGDPIVTGLTVYRCPYCPAWHVGRSMKKGIDWQAVASAESKLRQRIARRAVGVAP